MGDRTVGGGRARPALPASRRRRLAHATASSTRRPCGGRAPSAVPACGAATTCPSITRTTIAAQEHWHGLGRLRRATRVSTPTFAASRSSTSSRTRGHATSCAPAHSSTGSPRSRARSHALELVIVSRRRRPADRLPAARGLGARVLGRSRARDATCRSRSATRSRASATRRAPPARRRACSSRGDGCGRTTAGSGSPGTTCTTAPFPCSTCRACCRSRGSASPAARSCCATRSRPRSSGTTCAATAARRRRSFPR